MRGVWLLASGFCSMSTGISCRRLPAVGRRQLNLFLLSGSLLVQVQLDSTLSRLALVVHVLIFGLLSAVTCQGGHRTTDGTLSTITDTLSEIGQLTLSFLSLTLEVLIATLLLEALAADEVTDSLLSTANGLIP